MLRLRSEIASRSHCSAQHDRGEDSRGGAGHPISTLSRTSHPRPANVAANYSRGIHKVDAKSKSPPSPLVILSEAKTCVLAVSIGAHGECIGPSARKERGPQDDKFFWWSASVACGHAAVFLQPV